jgi:hypothetical protein
MVSFSEENRELNFITDWIDRNVRSHPFPDDLHAALSELVEQCLSAAVVAGISPEEIESATGCKAVDLIRATFLARWNPAVGDGGSA